MNRGVFAIALVVFAVSWVLPAYGGVPEEAAGRGPFDEIVKATEINGWRAFRATWDALFDGKQTDYRDWLLTFTCLTNVAMIVAAAGAWRASARFRRAFGFVLLFSAALNAGWIYWPDSAFREGLRYGYFAWTASFLVAGIALLSGGRPRAATT